MIANLLVTIALFIGTSQALWADLDTRVAPYYAESTEPHQLTFLNRGMSSLLSRLEIIEQAQERIEFEYFIVHDDPSTRLFMQALAKKAREGVRVRLIFDHFFVGSQITAYHAEALRTAGVEVRYYNPVPIIAARDIHYRNHRKLISVDDRIAIIGGRNLRDRYFDMHPDFNYIDRDMIVEGPLVKTMRQSFDAYWNAPITQPLPAPKRPSPGDLTYRRGPRSDAMRRYQDDLSRWIRLTREAREFIVESPKDNHLKSRIQQEIGPELKSKMSGTCHDLVWATDYPGVGSWAQERKYRLSSEITFEWMSEAKNDVFMESAFIIINGQTADLLDGLVDRGIRLRFMTNSLYSTDLILTSAVFIDRTRKWIDRGVEFAVYKGDAMPQHHIFQDIVGESRWGIHSKSIIVDDSFMIGSLNFDPRSFNWSSELILICRDEALTRELESSIQKRWDNSIELKTHEKVMKYRFDRLNFLNRLGYYLVKYPASLLDWHL
jgi:cardiolipin synthase C